MIDSVEKIITRYFASVTLEEFTYKKTTYKPKKLRVSTSIFFKTMTCVAKCGACCHRFSLDYIPVEKIAIEMREKDHRDEVSQKAIKAGERLKERHIDFDGRTVVVFSDTQEDLDSHSCRHLQSDTGYCGIHRSHPFSCDFELLRFTHFESLDSPNHLGHRPFGRGWNMKRIDGERGALCEWHDVPATKEEISDQARKLIRLKEWADHFGLTTTLPVIIDWVQRGPHEQALIVGPPTKGGFF